MCGLSLALLLTMPEVAPVATMVLAIIDMARMGMMCDV